MRFNYPECFPESFVTHTRILEGCKSFGILYCKGNVLGSIEHACSKLILSICYSSFGVHGVLSVGIAKKKLNKNDTSQ